MLAVYAASQSTTDPLSGLVVGERPDPQPREGWTDGRGCGPQRSTTTTSGRCAGSGCPPTDCR